MKIKCFPCILYTVLLLVWVWVIADILFINRVVQKCWLTKWLSVAIKVVVHSPCSKKVLDIDKQCTQLCERFSWQILGLMEAVHQGTQHVMAEPDTSWWSIYLASPKQPFVSFAITFSFFFQFTFAMELNFCCEHFNSCHILSPLIKCDSC